MTSCRRQSGFTILEVLVALVIAATASAVIFTHLRTLIDLNARVNEHQREVTAALNEAAYVLGPDWGARARTRLREQDIAVLLRGEFSPTLFVSNFMLDDKEALPPVDRAFTPYQLYRVQPGARYGVTFLFPNLPLDL